MKERCEIAVVGSGFSGSLIARILATQGYDVVLLERGTHPRFAIGESSTPMANLSLERIAKRYGLTDCYDLAAHGRWLERYPDVRRGLKRGFTFYRHHQGEPLANHDLNSERLLVAASPNDLVSDSHWLREDVDHHFVRQAIAAGVDYRDKTELTHVHNQPSGVLLSGTRDGAKLELRANFVIDASGPNGFLARHLRIPSGLDHTHTRSALVFSHFKDVPLLGDVMPGFPEGPFPDDWAAMHHIVDEGWMYQLRFDHGVVSSGFLLTPRGLATLTSPQSDAEALWREMLSRYPTIAALYERATPVMPIRFRPLIQHRLTKAAGKRWLLLPHSFAFIDPLFSTGIAWSLRAIERLGLMFESARESGARIPKSDDIARYVDVMTREGDQMDYLVAGAYEAMVHFDLFAAHAMIYFATVSFNEVRQRIRGESTASWRGFIGVGDAASASLPRDALRRLRHITGRRGHAGTAQQRKDYADWVRTAIDPRNVVGLADSARHNLYPVDLDVLVDRHAKLRLTREQMVQALPALRGS